MFLMIAGLALATASPRASAVPEIPSPHVRQRRRRAASAGSSELFSLRARRTFAAYLRMRLLEMREEGLDRAARAVEGSLPIRELLAEPH